MFTKCVKTCAAILACAFLSSCLTPKPKLTARYRTYDIAASTTNEEARLSVFVLDTPGSDAAATIVSLADRGQAALIDSLKDKSKTAEDLLHNAGSAIAKRKEAPPIIDRTRFKRRIVFSIENGKTEPADRLAIATITVNGLPQSASFLSWDKFTSKYESVDLGKLTYQQNNEINLGVTAAPPIPGITGAEAAATASRSLEEELLLKQRFVEFTGALNSREARITQQGVLGRDLTGNQTVDIEVQVNAHPVNLFVMTFPNLYEEGVRTDPAKVKMLRQRVIVPQNVEKDVTASASLEYLLRRVKRGKGDKTVMEGDDDVTFIKGKVWLKDPFTLIPSDDLEFFTWWLVDQSGVRALHITKSPGPCTMGAELEPIKFASYAGAVQFLNWLTKDHTKIGELQLCFNGTALTARQIEKLQVEIVAEGPGVKRRSQ